jgi:hypothetical protein
MQSLLECAAGEDIKLSDALTLLEIRGREPVGNCGMEVDLIGFC